ncbi:MAG TPA: hypothetical protein H9691_08435, partial [Firmicutes bacterium]|nr:hypothetical protein [Bacillota bacterium]
LLQQLPHQGKAKGLAACHSQTTSPFRCLNNFLSKYCLTFWGHFTEKPPCFFLYCKFEKNVCQRGKGRFPCQKMRPVFGGKAQKNRAF